MKRDEGTGLIRGCQSKDREKRRQLERQISPGVIKRYREGFKSAVKPSVGLMDS